MRELTAQERKLVSGGWGWGFNGGNDDEEESRQDTVHVRGTRYGYGGSGYTWGSPWAGDNSTTTPTNTNYGGGSSGDSADSSEEEADPQELADNVDKLIEDMMEDPDKAISDFDDWYSELSDADKAAVSSLIDAAVLEFQLHGQFAANNGMGDAAKVFGDLAKGLGLLGDALELYGGVSELVNNGVSQESVVGLLATIGGIALSYGATAAVAGSVGGPAGAVLGALAGFVVGVGVGLGGEAALNWSIDQANQFIAALNGALGDANNAADQWLDALAQAAATNVAPAFVPGTNSDGTPNFSYMNLIWTGTSDGRDGFIEIEP